MNVLNSFVIVDKNTCTLATLILILKIPCGPLYQRSPKAKKLVAVNIHSTIQLARSGPRNELPGTLAI